jgi:hypothetical protein
LLPDFATFWVVKFLLLNYQYELDSGHKLTLLYSVLADFQELSVIEAKIGLCSGALFCRRT